MLTLRTVRRQSLPLLTVALLGTVSAFAQQIDAPASLSPQLTAMAGTGLMLTGCQERMKTLDSMLSQAGYSAMRTYLIDGTTKVARWYHPEHHTTIVAFAGWQASDNTFTAGEFAGLMRWNELIATP